MPSNFLRENSTRIRRRNPVGKDFVVNESGILIINFWWFPFSSAGLGGEAKKGLPRCQADLRYFQLLQGVEHLDHALVFGVVATFNHDLGIGIGGF